MTDLEPSTQLLREIFLAGFMSGMPSENIAWIAPRLARSMTDVRLRAGEILYRQGDLTTDQFFVVTGELTLEAPDVPPWTLGAKSLVGALDVTLGRSRTRTVTATRDTYLLRLPAGEWLDLLEDNFEMSRFGIANLAKGLRALRLELDDLGLPLSPSPTASLGETSERDFDLVGRLLLLRSVPLFATADVQSLTSLAQLTHVVDRKAGDCLFHHGAADEALFIVVHGAVTAARAGVDHVACFGPGQLVLGSIAIAFEHLDYEVRATTATRALRLGREDCFDVMEEAFSLARSVMKALAAEREALMNEQAERQRSSTADLSSLSRNLKRFTFRSKGKLL